MRAPDEPTQVERDAHAPHHLPFRSWCEICVKGRAQANAHYNKEKGERDVPVIGIDYGHLTEGCNREVRGSGTGKPTLIIRDDKSKHLAAHMVTKKG